MTASGSFTVKTDGTVAFDISSNDKGSNTRWLLARGVLCTLDIATGTAKAIRKIDGPKNRISDIAVLPAAAPST